MYGCLWLLLILLLIVLDLLLLEVVLSVRVDRDDERRGLYSNP